jgi:phosphoribosylamine-glycine ligase
MDLRLERGGFRTGSSRSVAVVGLGSTLEEARRASLQGTESLRGQVRWRKDVASASDIRKSREHLRRLTHCMHAS